MNECCSMRILGTPMKSKKETVEEDVAGCWNALWATSCLWLWQNLHTLLVCVCVLGAETALATAACAAHREAVPWHCTLLSTWTHRALLVWESSALHRWEAHVNQRDPTRMNFHCEPGEGFFLQNNLEFSSYSTAFFSSSVKLFWNVFISLHVVQQSAK